MEVRVKLEKNKLSNIQILSKLNFPKLNYLSIGDDSLKDNLNELKSIKFPKLEDIRVYLNEKYNKKYKNITEITTYFENKGIYFKFIKYDKNGENEIMDDDNNFIHNYDDEDDEENEDTENFVDEGKLKDNLNDFLLKEGLI